MKKTFLNFVLIIAVIFSTSCKNEAKSESSDTADTTEEVERTDKTEEKSNTTSTTSASDGVPSFSDQKVQDYVNSYEAYIAEYKKVVESKDMAAFETLGSKGQELGTKAQEVMGNLSGDDVKKLNDYMMAKSTELQELSKKLLQ